MTSAQLIRQQAGNDVMNKVKEINEAMETVLDSRHLFLP